jgi:hypothetical protein
MALLRCPVCRTEITGDFPDVEATEPDGTAFDEFPCFDCVLAGMGDTDDAA